MNPKVWKHIPRFGSYPQVWKHPVKGFRWAENISRFFVNQGLICQHAGDSKWIVVVVRKGKGRLYLVRKGRELTRAHKVSLGILAHLLRMVMEPKCPMRFGGDEGHPLLILFMMPSTYDWVEWSLGKKCSEIKNFFVPDVQVMSVCPRVRCSWKTSKKDGFVVRSLEIWQFFLFNEIWQGWMKRNCVFFEFASHPTWY